jgi:hypothetical protein
MTAETVLGKMVEALGRPLVSIRIEVVPIDLVTEWRRCGIVADFAAEYLEWAFLRRDVAHSVLSTVLNELVENAAKFSVDARARTEIALLHYGEMVHLEVRNVSPQEHVERLARILDDLARDGGDAVFRRCMEERFGLGLALIARDYAATVGARVSAGTNKGESAVCVRVSLSAREVEQR